MKKSTLRIGVVGFSYPASGSEDAGLA